MQTVITRSDSFEYEGNLPNLMVVRVFKMIGGDTEYAEVWQPRAEHSTITHFTINGQVVCFGLYHTFGKLPATIDALPGGSDARWDAVMAWYSQRAIEAQHIAEEALGCRVTFDRNGRYPVDEAAHG